MACTLLTWVHAQARGCNHLKKERCCLLSCLPPPGAYGPVRAPLSATPLYSEQLPAPKVGMPPLLVLDKRNVSAHLPAGTPVSFPGKQLLAAGQALTHCAEHCAAEKESAQEGPIFGRLEPLGLHPLQMLTQVLPVAFHHWEETRVIKRGLPARQSCPARIQGPAAPLPHPQYPNNA